MKAFGYLMICVVGDRIADELQCANGDELISQVRNFTHHTLLGVNECLTFFFSLSVKV